jgi:molybdopterin-guanine dinucleotide biosynthesis protein A
MACPGSPATTALGVVLAGGAGQRLGGGKPMVPLAGRPLDAWACEALRGVLADVVLVAKPETRLPALPGIATWREPEEPRHPLFGLVWSLERAQGRPVVVCAGDLPLVPGGLLQRLATRPPHPDVRATVTAAEGRLQPLLGRYEPAALKPLRAALAADPGISLTHAVGALQPVVLDAPAGALANVNTREDLQAAAAILGAPGRRLSRG